MKVSAILEELGGEGRRRDLLAHCSERELQSAVADGSAVRLSRGRYGLAPDRSAESAAVEASGVLSHASAAEWYGWTLRQPPERPVVTVPRHRKVPAHLRERFDIRYADLPAASVRGVVTTPAATVVARARTLPFDEALCIADAALRRDHVDRDALAAAVLAAPRSGRARAGQVVDFADPRAANAFESVARAISREVGGLVLEPQVRIAEGITSDLVDRRLRIVVECDSWTYHAEKSAFRRDLARYNTVQLDGWLLLRFDRRHVMEQPAYVRQCLEAAVDRQTVK